MWIFGAVAVLANVSIAADYTIKNYNVDMELRTDGSMLVNETIDVNFSQQKHGIIRKIATKNPNNGRVTSISSPMVEWDNFQVSRENDMVKLKIWDPNSTVYGDHKYQISYVVDNAIVSFGSGAWQELYWNVIGTEWTTSIDKAYFSLKLPKDYVSNGDKYYAVRGYNGERKKENLIFDLVWSEEFRWNLEQYMRAGEGLTVYVPFASGYFELPQDYGKYFGYESEENPVEEQKIDLNEKIWGTVKTDITFDDFEVNDFLIFVKWGLGVIGVSIIFLSLAVWGRNRLIPWFSIPIEDQNFSQENLDPNSSLKKWKRSIQVLGAICFCISVLGLLFQILPDRISDAYWLWNWFVWIWFFIVIFFIFYGMFLVSASNKGFHYRGKDPIIPYYLPPKWDAIDLFTFASRNYLANDVIASLLYYWAIKGWITISYHVDKFMWFSVNQSVTLDPGERSDAQKWFDPTFSAFFSSSKKIIITNHRDENLYYKLKHLSGDFDDLYDENSIKYKWKSLQVFCKFFYYETLSKTGRDLYDHLRGFKYYLEKVERPQIETFLNEDTEYLDKILPWVVLFGLQTKLSEKIGDLMDLRTQKFIVENWDISSILVLSNLTSNIRANEISPRSNDSFGRDSDRWSGGGSSGSSDSWTSGGWGWWGWWDSW